MRGLAFLLLLVTAGTSQVPKQLLAELKDPRDEVREAAVLKLSRIKPGSEAEARSVAQLLAQALSDPYPLVSGHAADALGRDRPSDIAIPALVSALSRIGTSPPGLRERGSGLLHVCYPPALAAKCIGAAASSLLRSLAQHWSAQAVMGLADVVRGWSLTSIPGDVVEEACEILCRWGTRDSLDAVVGVMRRGALLPRVEPVVPGPWGLPLRNESYQMFLLNPDQRDRIGMTLMRRLVTMGVTPTAGVYDGSPEAWKLMLQQEGDRFPMSLPTRPTSRPTSRSREAK